MARDEDRLEPRLGCSRRDMVRTPATLRKALMGRVVRAGGNTAPAAEPPLPRASEQPAPLNGNGTEPGR